MNSSISAIAVFALFQTSALGAVPVLWQVQLQARSTNVSNIPTFNLPAGAAITNQSAAISDDGFAAIHFTTPITSGTEGFFVGRNGSGSIPIVSASGTGFSPSDLDFASGYLTCISQSSPRNVSLRSATSGIQNHLFDSPNPEDVVTYSRPRIFNAAHAIGYRGVTSNGVRKWIVDSFSGPTRTQTLYLSDGPATSYSFLYPPTTNALGHMGGKIDDLSGRAFIIRADSPTTRVILFDGNQPNVDFVGGTTDMNDVDQVAFFVRYITGATTRYSLLRSDGITTATIATAGDVGILSADMANFPPAINNSGITAFRAKDAAGDALFVGDGIRVVRIVGHNDFVATDLGHMQLGSVNDAAISGSLDINAAGQIAFSAVLSNGCTGLFIATPCYADFNADMIVDLFDYLDFVSIFAAGDIAADFNNDGIVDFFDYLDFLASFANGC